jgi:hypothetical protein
MSEIEQLVEAYKKRYLSPEKPITEKEEKSVEAKKPK